MGFLRTVLKLIDPSVVPSRKLSCQLATVNIYMALSVANQDGHNSQHFLFLCYKGLFLLEIPETSNLESLRCKEQTVFHSDKTALEWSQTGTKWFLSAGVVTDALWEWLATCPHRVPSWHINCTLSALWVISWLFLNHSPS